MHECSESGDLSVVSGDKCETDQTGSSFTKTEQCNVESCDEDQIATILTCKDTENGCCSTDLSTPADEDYRNCPQILANETESKPCKESLFGCCVGTPGAEALGPFGLGCPVSCVNTKFGCCDDAVTIANASDKIGCPVEELPTTTTTLAPEITTTLGMFYLCYAIV